MGLLRTTKDEGRPRDCSNGLGLNRPHPGAACDVTRRCSAPRAKLLLPGREARLEAHPDALVEAGRPRLRFAVDVQVDAGHAPAVELDEGVPEHRLPDAAAAEGPEHAQLDHVA